MRIVHNDMEGFLVDLEDQVGRRVVHLDRGNIQNATAGGGESVSGGVVVSGGTGIDRNGNKRCNRKMFQLVLHTMLFGF